MDYYIYLRRRNSDARVYYVGKGMARRAWSRHGRSSHWKSTVNKHGYYVEIVECGLQEWYAFELEISLIDYYGRKDLGYGELVNLQDGGFGDTRESRTSKDERLKQSIKMSGNGNIKADKNIYNFENVHTLEVFRGTRYDLETKIGKSINDLFKTDCYSINGWTVDWKEGCNPTHDLNHYLFRTRDGRFFSGTRVSFKEEYGYGLKPLFSDIRKMKTCKGWYLVCIVFQRKYK